MRARLVAATAVVVLVPAALYPLTGPWTLLWIPVVLLLGAAALLRSRAHAQVRARARASGTRGRDEAVDGADATDPGDPAVLGGRAAENGRGRRIRPVALPSAVEDYELHFSAVVHWRWNGHVDLSLRNPIGPAVYWVATRAAELARETDPADHGLAEYDLAARLAVETAVTGAGIVVWAEDVALRLPDEDADRLERLSGLRKDRELREAVRAVEAEGAASRVLVSRQRTVPTGEGDLDAFGELGERGGFGDLGDLGDLSDDDLEPLEGDDPVPGNDVDGEGFESYWWPAETDGHDAAERDVQVAIIRGLIDSVDEGSEREAFAREQLDVLERAGFGEVARRIREAVPDLAGPHEQPEI